MLTAKNRRFGKSVVAFAGLAAFALVASGDVAHAQNWPQFRGRGASGLGSGQPPVTWNVTTGENIKWKVPIEGLAHSSPIVYGNRVFLTTAVNDSNEEAELTKGWEAAGGRSAKDSGRWIWKVLCLDRETGRLLWWREAHRGVPKHKRHPKSTYANCTPATNGKQVVAFFGSEGLYSYDVDGDLLWKKDLGPLNSSPKRAPELQWGFASSPIIHNGNVVVQCDCENTSFWASFDVRSGQELHRVTRDEDTTWSTPSAFKINGRDCLVLNGYKHMGAYDLQTGKELWRLHGGGDVPVPAPLYARGLIFLTNSHGGRRPIYAIEPTARGDITPKTEGKTPGLAWWTDKAGSYIPTPIVHGYNLYVGDDNGVLTVFDAETGKRKYRERLAGGGANYSASPVAAGGKIYFTSEDGDIHVIEAGDHYKLLATNAMNETCMATPAISDGLLFIRTRHQLYCIGK